MRLPILAHTGPRQWAVFIVVAAVVFSAVALVAVVNRRPSGSQAPDLARILLDDDWEGHPLRKDYALEFVENAWTGRTPAIAYLQRHRSEGRVAVRLPRSTNGMSSRVR